jgi:hypothetical protein
MVSHTDSDDFDNENTKIRQSGGHRSQVIGIRAWFTTFLLLYSRDVAAKFSEICHFSLLYSEERRGLRYSSSFAKLPVLAICKPYSYFKHLKF